MHYICLQYLYIDLIKMHWYYIVRIPNYRSLLQVLPNINIWTTLKTNYTLIKSVSNDWTIFRQSKLLIYGPEIMQNSIIQILRIPNCRSLLQVLPNTWRRVMLITLSRRTAICQSVAEVWLTGAAPLGAVSHRFIYIILLFLFYLVTWQLWINYGIIFANHSQSILPSYRYWKCIENDKYHDEMLLLKSR